MLWPEDAFALYDVTETTVTLAGGMSKVLVVPENPQRICLIFGNVSSGMVVTTVPGGTGTGGVQLNSTLAPLLLSFSAHGPLPAMAWYSQSAGTITFLEVILRRHPAANGRAETCPSDVKSSSPLSP